jgi:hypothetical protein
MRRELKPKLSYTVGEVAEYLGVSRTSIRRAIERGNLKLLSRKPQKICVGELKRFVASQHGRETDQGRRFSRQSAKSIPFRRSKSERWTSYREPAHLPLSNRTLKDLMYRGTLEEPIRKIKWGESRREQFQRLHEEAQNNASEEHKAESTVENHLNPEQAHDERKTDGPSEPTNMGGQS